MADPSGSTAERGDLARTAGVEVISRLTDGTGVTKGDACHMDTNGLVVKGTTAGQQDWGFCVALETIGASAACRVAIGNTYVYCTADVAIIPFEAVKIAATAGEVGPNVKPLPSTLNTTFAETEAEVDIDLAVDYFDKHFGRYIGHQTELVGDPTDAASGDIVIIRLGM